MRIIAPPTLGLMSISMWSLIYVQIPAWLGSYLYQIMPLPQRSDEMTIDEKGFEGSEILFVINDLSLHHLYLIMHHIFDLKLCLNTIHI